MRLLLVSVLLASLLLALSSATASALAGDTSISGGRLPYAIRLSPIDESALMRRVNSPPQLEKEPKTTGPSYRLDSSYWATVLPKTNKEPSPAERAAEYFPDGGFVKARQGGKDAWVVLDLRQRAIIDRYIRLGEKGALSASPGELEVMRAAAADGEVIGIQVASRALTDDETAKFWTVAEGQSPTQPAVPVPQSPIFGGSFVWLLFTLPEGFQVRFAYSAASGVLISEAGDEFYAVPFRWLVPVIGAEAAPDAIIGLRPTDIKNQRSPGSPLWWPIGLGAGGLLISVAIWLQRRLAAART
jgi:hypothetical protein